MPGGRHRTVKGFYMASPDHIFFLMRNCAGNMVNDITGNPTDYRQGEQKQVCEE